jgi:glucose/arabinose dehydrogenase
MRGFPLSATLVVAVLLAACESARLPFEAGVGPSPRLPAPVRTPLPTVDIAPAKGWPADAAPVPANGLAVTAFARDLQHPRWLAVLPNGDVLVAESNAPPRETPPGLRGILMGLVMKRAGAGVPSANRITLLRDADGDGRAETRSTLLEGLHSPFGMALVGNDLYVANADAIVRFPYTPGTTRIADPGTRFAPLPGGPRNHHWTKNLLASRDGTKLYATVGSNSNVAEFGLAEEEGRAAIWEFDVATGRGRLFATGLRNPNGLAFEPSTGVPWTVVNERDELGSDLVPDYLTSVRDGGFYGWPWSYFGTHVDERVQPPRPDLVAKAIVPDYALGTHVAPLGLAFAADAKLGARFASGAFIGQHGSWNRRPPAGYDVVFVPFANGKPSGMPIRVLGGFLSPGGDAYGRPVGVAIDARGGLLVADDVGNVVWRVTAERG